MNPRDEFEEYLLDIFKIVWRDAQFGQEDQLVVCQSATVVSLKIADKYAKAMVEEAQHLPMGVSQWREHGRKHGYWGYFAKEVIAAELERLIRPSDRYTELYANVPETYIAIGHIKNRLAELRKGWK